MMAMKYDEYRNSGVKWLGLIPSSWSIKRLKGLMTFQGGAAFASKDYTDKGIQLILIGNLYQNRLSLDRNPTFVPESFMSKYSRYKVSKDDILISLTGTLGKKDYGFAILIEENEIYLLNQRVAKLSCNKEVNIRYMIFLLQSEEFGNELLTLPKGTKQGNLSEDQILSMEIPFFPYTEQTQIANYLDCKTAAIDKKIALLEQKSKHYQELRKSLINETVCRGLNKTAKLKNSGIDWIGQIPEHWEVKRFKDVVLKYTTGGTPSTSNANYFNGENIWICISDIKESKFISNSKIRLTDEAIKNTNILKTPKGSLLYSFKLSIGKMAFVECDVYTNEAILSIFPNKYIDLEYYYFMLPQFMLLAATENIYGANMLNQKLISNALILHPPKNEQIIISAYLDIQTTKIDQITTNIKNQIDTLKELRKTLINDVVTGQIRVCEVLEKEMANQ